MSIRYDRKFFEYLENLKRYILTQPLALGGTAGYSGGGGGNPTGYVGYLPQTRISYDYSENEIETLSPSGVSLLDNLNYIRYRIADLESTEGVRYIEDLSDQVDGAETEFTTTYIFQENAINVFYNGLSQLPASISSGNGLFVLDFTPVSESTLTADYTYLLEDN